MHFYACWLFLFAHFHLRLSEIIQSHHGNVHPKRTMYNLYGTDLTTSANAFKKDTIIIEQSCYSKCLHTPRCFSFEVFVDSTNARVIECSLFSTVYQTNKTLIAKAGAKYYSKFLQHEDCVSWYDAGETEPGVYEVALLGKFPMQVRCEVDDIIGGGWMVFQNRFDGSVSFDNTWEQYKRGFGYIDGEFWLGNEWLHLLTQSKTHHFIVEAKSFAGVKRRKHFDNITIDSEVNHYAINFDRHDQADGFTPKGLFKDLESNPFSTKDKINVGVVNCAQLYGGGWYFNVNYNNGCHRDIMNGEYPMETYSDGQYPHGKGIIWYRWNGLETSLKTSKLMIRPRTE